MTGTSLTTVDFHGATLLAQVGITPDVTLVAMKPVVEGMGLDWGGQHRKMLAHPVLSKGISVIGIPSDGGLQNSTALPLNRLSFWLVTIHPDRIRDADVRSRVIQYQTECADVLFAHFFGEKAAAAGSDYLEADDGEVQTSDGVKLRKVNTATRIFGERAGAQLWVKLGLEIVPAMRPMLSQFDMLEIETTSVTTRVSGGSH